MPRLPVYLHRPQARCLGIRPNFPQRFPQPVDSLTTAVLAFRHADELPAARARDVPPMRAPRQSEAGAHHHRAGRRYQVVLHGM